MRAPAGSFAQDDRTRTSSSSSSIPSTGRPRSRARRRSDPRAASPSSASPTRSRTRSRSAARSSAIRSPPPEYDAALAFADWCIEQRLETPRALEVAEEIYRARRGRLHRGPAPRLGLARCYEAGFQFEKAFQEYQRAARGQPEGNPLVLGAPGASSKRASACSTTAESALPRSRTLRAHDVARCRRRSAGSSSRAGARRRRVEHLRLANQYEPTGAERKRERARMRADLGAALLATGDVAGARASGSRRRGRPIRPSPPALVRTRSCAAALTRPAAGARTAARDRGPAGPTRRRVSSSCSRPGSRRCASDDAASAAQARASAARGGRRPIRCARSCAWRALSFLAEVTGTPRKRCASPSRRVENDPTDPWTAVPARADPRVARRPRRRDATSFSRALELELDFVDALAAMGELRTAAASSRRPSATSSARSRSIRRSSPSPALRGVNFLELGALARRREDLQGGARARDQDQPTARNGLAWCRYRRGEVRARR